MDLIGRHEGRPDRSLVPSDLGVYAFPVFGDAGTHDAPDTTVAGLASHCNDIADFQRCTVGVENADHGDLLCPGGPGEPWK